MTLRSLVRASVRPLTAYAPPDADGAVKLDANECPWPLAAEARALIAERVARLDLHRYPDPRARALRRALVARIGGEPAEYVFGVGSDEVIAMLLAVFAEPRADRTRAVVLHPTPTFVMYSITARTLGVEPLGVPLAPDWSLDVDAMTDALRAHQPNLVFLASPNNPTGSSFDLDALSTVIEADPGALFVLDEAYGWYASERCDRLFGVHPNVALLGTLSKIGVAGARVGWCRLPAELAAELDKGRQPYNLSSVSQAVASTILDELWTDLMTHAGRVVDERLRLASALAEHARFEVHPSDANFLWVRDAGDTDALVRALHEAGVRVKSFHGHGGRLTGHLRITVGMPEENDALLAALP